MCTYACSAMKGPADEVNGKIREGNWAQGSLKTGCAAVSLRNFERWMIIYLQERAVDVARTWVERLFVASAGKGEQASLEYPEHVLVSGRESPPLCWAEVPKASWWIGVGERSSHSHVAILARAMAYPR